MRMWTWKEVLRTAEAILHRKYSEATRASHEPYTVQGLGSSYETPHMQGRAPSQAIRLNKDMIGLARLRVQSGCCCDAMADYCQHVNTQGPRSIMARMRATAFNPMREDETSGL